MVKTFVKSSGEGINRFVNFFLLFLVFFSLVFLSSQTLFLFDHFLKRFRLFRFGNFFRLFLTLVVNLGSLFRTNGIILHFGISLGITRRFTSAISFIFVFGFNNLCLGFISGEGNDNFVLLRFDDSISTRLRTNCLSLFDGNFFAFRNNPRSAGITRMTLNANSYTLWSTTKSVIVFFQKRLVIANIHR